MTGVVAVVVIGKVKENVTFSLHFSPGNSPVVVIIIIAIIRKRQTPIYLLPPTEKRSNRKPIIDQQWTNGRSAYVSDRPSDQPSAAFLRFPFLLFHPRNLFMADVVPF